jgi:NTP pyrophosphatase (non-canonical NTP hydrolase)
MRKILQDYQDEVHDWIKQFDPAYWTPHEILTHLTSELGELAKEINHEFGPLKKKKGEKESSILEETGDIFFGLICLLNSQGLSMDAAFRKAMEKRRGRDKRRFRLARKR